MSEEPTQHLIEVHVFEDGQEWVRTGLDEWTGGAPDVAEQTVLTVAEYVRLAAVHDVRVDTRGLM